MKYELTKDYLTGIGMIDEEHQKLFDLTNECYELVMDDAAVDRFDRIVALLEELRTYAASGTSICASSRNSARSTWTTSMRTSRRTC